MKGGDLLPDPGGMPHRLLTMYQDPPSGEYQNPPSGEYQNPPSDEYQNPPSGEYVSARRVSSTITCTIIPGGIWARIPSASTVCGAAIV